MGTKQVQDTPIYLCPESCRKMMDLPIEKLAFSGGISSGISMDVALVRQLMFSTVLLHWYLYRDGPNAAKKDWGAWSLQASYVMW